MDPSFRSTNYPAGQEVKPRDQPVPDDTQVSDSSGPPPAVNDPDVPASDSNSAPGPTDHFVPSSALDNPQPWTTQTTPPASSPTVISTSSLPVSTPATSSTGTLQPAPTAVSIQSGALSTSSSNKKYIIGGAVGGGVLVLILLGLLLFCCKRRPKRDLERSGGGDSEGQHGYGQFACCNHGTCNKNGGQLQTDQKTPLKPFVLRSDPVAPIPNARPQRRNISLNRRDSSESQKSAGSDSSADTLCSSYSEDSQPSKRRSQKRPPPLKLTSLVTPIVNGPQDNPRKGAGRPSPPGLHGVPAVVVNPPRSGTPERIRQH